MITTTNSGVTWGIVILFIYNTLNAIAGTIVSPTWSLVINAVVAGLSVIVHKQQIKSGKVGKAKY